MSRFWRQLQPRKRLGGRWLWVLPLALLLTGCVEYDVGIQFESPSHGEIVQHLHLGDRLQTLSSDQVRQGVAALAAQSRSVGGELEQTSNQDYVVRIPFRDAADLEARFNQFFEQVFEPAASPAAAPSLGRLGVRSHLSAQRQNFLLVERTHLRYELDLRSLGITTATGTVAPPAGWLDLSFRLQLPWGSHRSDPDGKARQAVWRPLPGRLNQFEVVFWMLNPIGIGAGVIGLLVWLGQRHLRSPTRPPVLLE